MSELASGSAGIADLIKRVDFYKASPVRSAQALFDYFDDVMNNRVSLVDTTNPFVLLAESAAVLSSMAVNTSLINLRKANPGLAETDEDIYRHMTDKEYIDRFATPGYANFIFMLQFDSLINNLEFDSVENCNKGIIPRDSIITVDTYTFTLEYPIVIRQFSNGVIQITYDLSIESPISKPSNNIIPFKVRQDATGNRTLYFTVPVKQMKLESFNFATSRSSVFRQEVLFDDEFVHARVFQKTNSNSTWNELRSTHSDQVFDNDVPTALLEVLDGKLNVSIPYIYQSLGLLGSSIRVDIYTTKGEVSIDLGTYKTENYTTRLRNIDTVRDDSVFTNIWSAVNYIAFSTEILNSGKNGISFDTLKQKIKDYAFGKTDIPITTSKLDSLVQANGFSLVRSADSVTERILLGTRAIPEISVLDASSKTQRFLHKANIGIVRFSASLSELEASDNVVANNNRLTLLSNSAFLSSNGKSNLVDLSAINAIKSQSVSQLVSTVNSSSFSYTPYYYVFELQDGLLDVRPYDLDTPDSSNLSFVLQNTTLIQVVNTGSYAIKKTPGGYELTILTLSGTSYKQLNNNQVGVQLRLTSKDGTLTGTINGTFVATDPDTSERAYVFNIETNHDIDSDHAIQITNAYNQEGLLTNFYVGLETTVDILFTTTSITSNFVADETDTIVNKTQLPIGSVGNSRDSLNLFLGKFLEHLWSRSRTFAESQKYLTSDVDIPALYENDVYQTNPVTGSMLFIDNTGAPYYNKIHNQGDVIRDSNNQIVYKYRVGDTILDNNGQPILITPVTAKNEFDIFVIDGSLLFVTDSEYVNYRNQVSKIVTQWIIQDILEIQKRLIYKTTIYFYPEASLGVTQIIVNGNQKVYVSSEQSPIVQVFMDQSLIDDQKVKNIITDTVFKYLDKNISRTKFAVSTLEKELKDILGGNVFGLTISGIGGSTNNYRALSVLDENNRLCIKRKLFVNTDNIITIKPDIDVAFVKL